MDARQYLAQKGLDGKPDSRPHSTLEEQSWARARKSGQQRPRAGTPHDWEDWERYHEDLAKGAERLVQKTSAGGRLSDQVSNRGSKTEESKVEETVAEGSHRARPLIAFVTLAIVFPPLAVGLSGGGARPVTISLLLTLLGWLPGVVFALYWLTRR